MAQVTKITGLASAIRGCNSWQDVQIKWQEYSEDLKGYFFEELVKAYLQIDCEYASKLKHVWHGREVPLAIANKLKLPVLDKGIDIVAETHDGAFWAIQCKYRQHTDQSLTWKELSTFTGLAFGVCRGISFGIVCSTTERYTHVLKKQEHIGFCALDVWQSLDSEFFKRLRAHLAHKPEILKPLRPRPHQKIALEDGHAHFVTAKAKRGKLVMPCGSGKSLTAYFLAEKLEARRIVIAVPSLALIRQTLKVWLRETQANGQPVEWICVCSDESAGRVDRDDAAVLRQDLGVPCLTDTDEIARWLKRKHAGLTIVFTTYQSGEALAQAARSIKFRFDLGIMDEAHKTVGDRSKLFSHLLHDENLPIRRRLFMTATERRYAGQSDTVLSMDDPAIYGETFHLLSFKRAMEYNPPILSDYKIISMSVSRAEIAALIRENTFVVPDKGAWNQEIEADMLASLIALRKAMAKYPIRHAVSFHGSIQRAELFKSHNDVFSHTHPELGQLETFHVSGKTPTGTRARVIGDFARAERALVTNARCLTEGVDVPGIDCVLFADPRRSAVDIVQAVGRALRPAPGKEFGYVIVPILHDDDATADDLFNSDSFKEILTTLRALAANDDRIIEYFKAISQGQQRKGGASVQFDIDERLAEHIDLAQFVREIELKCWDRLAKLSWRSFEEAREFVWGLHLKNQAQWKVFSKGDMSADLPSNPNNVYADQGWKSWGDWLGTGVVANRLKEYRSFTQARTFVRGLKLKNQAEWRALRKGKMQHLGRLPNDIPAEPGRAYADEGWSGFGDWLGTGTIAARLKKYRSFSMARSFARRLKLKNQSEWHIFCKGELPEKGELPADIPANPNKTYATQGWTGMGDWLGTGTIAARLKKYRSFSMARTFARGLKLKSDSEWRAFCKGEMLHLGRLPADIPSMPRQTYSDKGWISIGDWLGTGKIAAKLREYRSFTQSRAFVHSLNLKNRAEWNEFSKGRITHLGHLPANIPTNPWKTYSDKGWTSLGDWLGTDSVAPRLRRFRSFREARIFVHELQLKSHSDWNAYCKGEIPEKGRLPDDIPKAPDQKYGDKGWKSWGDWLGTGRIADQLRRYRPFAQARAFARTLKLKRQAEWHAFCKGEMPRLGRLPTDIPANPNQTYADKGWQSMGDWLGTGRTRVSKSPKRG